MNNEKLEGVTLSVYLYIAKKGRPIGPRDAMKGAHLSSPSVAYRHLQKLEDMDLLQKNEYGEYFVKNKASMTGYMWVGQHVLPKMFTCSSIFLCILATEAIILGIHYAVETYRFVVFFSLLMLVTGSATAVFTVEGLLQSKYAKMSLQSEA